ncbi:MAG TPA: hypothetical protein VKZ53_20460 [Candidatus Angelobacter sp.]|nr:hypothetical protein [Candidatus Angelobacter sp.]
MSLIHIFRKLHLYSRRRFQVIAVLLLTCAGLWAVPNVLQHRNSHKLRATALLELTTDSNGVTHSQLTPITILIDNRFRDASIYERKPRPMSLENGVVYEAQKSGVPTGYVTILNGEEKDGIWVALGKWQAAAAKPAPEKPALAADATVSAPSGSSTPDDRPILHRGNAPASTPTPSTPAPSAQATPAPPSDPDRPVLVHPGNASGATPTPTPETPTAQASPTPEPPPDPDRPVLAHRGKNQQPAAKSGISPVQTTSGPPPPSDPDRPVLSRKGEVKETKLPAGSVKAGKQVLVAVSDAQATETRSYEYIWKTGEEQEIQFKMRKLALAQLPRDSSGVTEAAFSKVVMRSFDVDLTNDAIVVFSAELPGPTSKDSSGARSATRYVTVIARVDIEGNPEKLAASVADSSKLDVVPRLELIDAVDVDGDGLAELLFREYGFDQKGFVIYGVGHGTLSKIFEGATQPLRSPADTATANH